MADYSTQIKLVIEAQNKATTELSKLGIEMGKLKDKTDKSGLSLGSMIGALGGAAAIYGVLKTGIIDSIKAFDESEKVMAQTEAVITSTKGAAGLTAKAIGNLASKYQLLSTYSDEVIQGSENILLTFTNISKNVFPEATQAVLDMATAMGQDLKDTAIQVGKALQDPILGVTALRRVGVNFNDTRS